MAKSNKKKDKKLPKKTIKLELYNKYYLTPADRSITFLELKWKLFSSEDSYNEAIKEVEEKASCDLLTRLLGWAANYGTSEQAAEALKNLAFANSRSIYRQLFSAGKITAINDSFLVIEEATEFKALFNKIQNCENVSEVYKLAYLSELAYQLSFYDLAFLFIFLNIEFANFFSNEALQRVIKSLTEEDRNVLFDLIMHEISLEASKSIIFRTIGTIIEEERETKVDSLISLLGNIDSPNYGNNVILMLNYAIITNSFAIIEHITSHFSAYLELTQDSKFYRFFLDIVEQAIMRGDPSIISMFIKESLWSLYTDSDKLKLLEVLIVRAGKTTVGIILQKLYENKFLTAKLYEDLCDKNKEQNEILQILKPFEALVLDESYNEAIEFLDKVKNSANTILALVNFAKIFQNLIKSDQDKIIRNNLNKIKDIIDKAVDNEAIPKVILEKYPALALFIREYNIMQLIVDEEDIKPKPKPKPTLFIKTSSFKNKELPPVIIENKENVASIKTLPQIAEDTAPSSEWEVVDYAKKKCEVSRPKKFMIEATKKQISNPIESIESLNKKMDPLLEKAQNEVKEGLDIPAVTEEKMGSASMSDKRSTYDSEQLNERVKKLERNNIELQEKYDRLQEQHLQTSQQEPQHLHPKGTVYYHTCVGPAGWYSLPVLHPDYNSVNYMQGSVKKSVKQQSNKISNDKGSAKQNSLSVVLKAKEYKQTEMVIIVKKELPKAPISQRQEYDEIILEIKKREKALVAKINDSKNDSYVQLDNQKLIATPFYTMMESLFMEEQKMLGIDIQPQHNWAIAW